MDDPVPVREGQCVCDLSRDLERVFHRELGLASQAITQRLPLHVRHDVIEKTIGLA